MSSKGLFSICLIIIAPILVFNYQSPSMNGSRVFFTDQNLNPNAQVQGTNTHFEHLFKNFLHNFIRDNIRVYQRRLEMQIRNRKYVLPVEISDLRSFDQQLFDRLSASPLEMLGIMETTVQHYLREKVEQFPVNPKEDWQVVLRSDDHPVPIRDLKSHMVSRIFVISGIIISATKPYIKASRLEVQCKKCQNKKRFDLQPGQWPHVPSWCQGKPGQNEKCPKDSFVALPSSAVIDIQNLKIQQFPDEVPTGQVARTYTLIADRHNVSKCVPGSKMRVTGVMLVNETKNGEQLSRGYLYATGFQKINQRNEINYTAAEEEQFKAMSRDPDLLRKIYSSIAPGIFGNDQIKKAIACMLFGGSRKHLPDDTILRGDINVLLIGDPSTAKSQFLKFVQQTASIAVFTSGKGSSAAGLTASITKDSNTGEFQIEGGALVLADGGIVCIDQFDKMKQADRVAIHEAMEQQTISVAKAGITTRLNSRTSVLAAANPIFGRFDDFKGLEDQIELKSTILSRFDCIFIVRDVNSPEANQKIASHILNMHQGREIKTNQTGISFDLLKKYIKYAKSKVQPRLSSMAADQLIGQYVADRQKANEQAKLRNSTNPIPITVRQLEAVIRLSQSLARMKLKSQVGQEEVEDAHYLFQISTIKTIEGSRQFGYNLAEGAADEVQKAEDVIRKRVCVGNQVATISLTNQLQSKFSLNIITHAIYNLVKKQQFKQIRGRKFLIRQR